MTASLKPFTISDIEDFNCRDLTWDEFYQEDLLALPMVTFRVEDNIVAIFGIREIHTGVAEAFLYGDHRIKEYKDSFHRVSKKLTLFSMEKYNLHRLEIIVDKVNYKWAEALGFELETVLRKYNEDKSDAYLFVRFE